MSTFKYYYSLDDESKTLYASTEANVTLITFHIGRYRQNKHAIKFKTPITTSKAIDAVEKWLSQPLTNIEFEKLLETKDIIGGRAERKKYYQYRHDALVGVRFLEKIAFTSEGHIELILCKGLSMLD